MQPAQKCKIYTNLQTSCLSFYETVSGIFFQDLDPASCEMFFLSTSSKLSMPIFKRKCHFRATGGVFLSASSFSKSLGSRFTKKFSIRLRRRSRNRCAALRSVALFVRKAVRSKKKPSTGKTSCFLARNSKRGNFKR